MGPAKIAVEADAYLPITREEIKEAARGRSLFTNLWFGRRDRIPPADDLRTKLIDRGMVTQGLLTPEQLREIHEVADEMERVRPTIEGVEHRAQKHGDAAIQALREEKARIKAEKKAEAAEKKRQQAAGVAHRRATDIVFLGRGVSGRLHDRSADLDKLSSAGLPVLSTPSELADALGLSVPKLRWLAFHNEVAERTHYVRFEIPKKSGGVRVLHAPHRTLAQAQRWIFESILTRVGTEETAHGFVRGRSIVTNAEPHAGKAVVVNLDLKDFFPSIGFPRVRSVFHRLGYSPAVATILALLCTECPRVVARYEGRPYHVATGPRALPQGACTSPTLSNLVSRRFDRRLVGLSRALGIAYTRYADDLTFSGDETLESRVGYLMACVRHIAEDEGFSVNASKTRVLGRNAAQLVTGLVVNERPKARREEIRRVRAILHRARREGLERQNREGRPDILPWLRGKIAFIDMTQPELAAKMRAELDAIVDGSA
jgi:retron-type reverse transcriptase